MTTIGEALKFVRVARGLKLGTVAGRCGLSAGYISLLERGQRDPTWRTVIAICRALEISPTLVTCFMERDHPMLRGLMPLALNELLRSVK